MLTSHYPHREDLHVCHQQFRMHPNMWEDLCNLHKQMNEWMNARLQATVLVVGQVRNLSDPVLNADPLFGVTGQFAHTP